MKMPRRRNAAGDSTSARARSVTVAAGHQKWSRNRPGRRVHSGTLMPAWTATCSATAASSASVRASTRPGSASIRRAVSSGPRASRTSSRKSATAARRSTPPTMRWAARTSVSGSRGVAGRYASSSGPAARSARCSQIRAEGVVIRPLCGPTPRPSAIRSRWRDSASAVTAKQARPFAPSVESLVESLRAFALIAPVLSVRLGVASVLVGPWGIRRAHS